MSMKTILVPTENHDAMRSTLETALLLARRSTVTLIWIFQVKASTSRQSPSARNNAAAAAASRDCKAASNATSQPSASACGVRRGRSSTNVIGKYYGNAAACTMRGMRLAPASQKKRRAKPANFAPFMASCDSDTVATISCAGG